MTEIIVASSGATNCDGVLQLSEEALTLISELKGVKTVASDLKRTDPELIEVVRQLGKQALNGYHAHLTIEKIPWEYARLDAYKFEFDTGGYNDEILRLLEEPLLREKIRILEMQLKEQSLKEIEMRKQYLGKILKNPQL